MSNRESWLEAACSALTPLVLAHAPEFEQPRVSVGFAKGGPASSIGWCLPAIVCEDGRRQIFISPALVDETDEQGVLATLLHEMCHAALPDTEGHGKEFGALAGAVGLEKPWSANTAPPALLERLKEIARKLGPYPHSRVDLSRMEGGRKQGTRMVKCSCAACGYVCRTTAKWLESSGSPLCPCNHDPMYYERDVLAELGLVFTPEGDEE